WHRAGLLSSIPGYQSAWRAAADGLAGHVRAAPAYVDRRAGHARRPGRPGPSADSAGAERAIVDKAVRQLPRRAGSVNQWADATDVLERPALLQGLRAAYQAGGRGDVARRQV